ELVPAPPTARSIEAATRMPAGRRASLDEARRHTGVAPPLRDAHILAIATSQAPIASLVCEVNGQTVVLALARAANLPDAPPSLLRTKRIEVRREAGRRLFTWSASGDAYSLSVPNGVEAARACALCHAGTRIAPFIASSMRGF
ncbi:MAG TPA: hypothetical protein VJ276_25805, partial [Thermoanaerobaculia bacterium]|nr:hypothetical protein [Thermoanaerobaculia bacterium]